MNQKHGLTDGQILLRILIVVCVVALVIAVLQSLGMTGAAY